MKTSGFCLKGGELKLLDYIKMELELKGFNLKKEKEIKDENGNIVELESRIVLRN